MCCSAPFLLSRRSSPRPTSPASLGVRGRPLRVPRCCSPSLPVFWRGVVAIQVPPGLCWLSSSFWGLVLCGPGWLPPALEGGAPSLLLQEGVLVPRCPLHLLWSLWLPQLWLRLSGPAVKMLKPSSLDPRVAAGAGTSPDPQTLQEENGC